MLYESYLDCEHSNLGCVMLQKGKPVPLKAWSGQEGSRKFKVPRFHDNGTGRW